LPATDIGHSYTPGRLRVMPSPAVPVADVLDDAEGVRAERVPVTYAAVMAVATPVVRWWARLTVVGQELLPTSGPTVLMVNHDSAWDPVVVGVAARRRQIRALAKSSLWKVAPMGWVLDRMGQIPIERGRGDLAALSAAIDHLGRGQCVGVFPEGTVSRGRQMPSLSGAGRLGLAVPGTRVLGVRITGAVDIVRFPHRPRIRVEFFEPAGGQPMPGETAIALTRRVMTEVRAKAPPALPGRAKNRARFQRLAEQAQPTNTQRGRQHR
jgi:1-acyl-sn-glycerol-3-phosphate acyltransferase